MTVMDRIRNLYIRAQEELVGETLPKYSKVVWAHGEDE